MGKKIDPAQSWKVLENSGMWNEKIVHTASSYGGAAAWRDREYSSDEQESLRVDVTRNGSTEY